MVLSSGTNLISFCAPSAFVQSSFSDKDFGGLAAPLAAPVAVGTGSAASGWAKPAPASMVCTEGQILPSSPHPKEFGIAIAERGSPSTRERASDILGDGPASNSDKM